MCMSTRNAAHRASFAGQADRGSMRISLRAGCLELPAPGMCTICTSRSREHTRRASVGFPISQLTGAGGRCWPQHTSASPGRRPLLLAPSVVLLVRLPPSRPRRSSWGPSSVSAHPASATGQDMCSFHAGGHCPLSLLIASLAALRSRLWLLLGWHRRLRGQLTFASQTSSGPRSQDQLAALSPSNTVSPTSGSAPPHPCCSRLQSPCPVPYMLQVLMTRDSLALAFLLVTALGSSSACSRSMVTASGSS